MLHFTDKSPYEGMKESVNKLGSNVYVSNAQRNSANLRHVVVTHLGRPPRLILEVGSFTGSGAIHAWAPLVLMNGTQDAMVICMDTWLGDINMRLGEKDFGPFMQVERGLPHLYDRFLQRVVDFQLTETIFPVHIDSITGARIFSTLNWRVDVIYLDSAHEIGMTFAEMMMFYQLLPPGGVMLGDDYNAFPAVRHDVELFVDRIKKKSLMNGGVPELTFELLKGDQWLIYKHQL